MAVAPLELFAPVFNGTGCDAGMTHSLPRLPYSLSAGDLARKGCFGSWWTGFTRCSSVKSPKHQFPTSLPQKGRQKYTVRSVRFCGAGDEYMHCKEQLIGYYYSVASVLLITGTWDILQQPCKIHCVHKLWMLIKGIWLW